jgi:hypothetical protein
MAGLKRRKPGLGKEEAPPFLARRMLFYPGMGPIGNKEYFPLAELLRIETFSDGNPMFPSTKLEMIHI